MRPVLSACLALTLLAAPAWAAPIRVTVEGKNDAYAAESYRVHALGVLARFTIDDEFLEQGGGVAFPTQGGIGSGAGTWSGWADLTLTFDRLTEGPPAAGSPTIRLVGILGGAVGAYEDGRPYGAWESAPVSATLADWTPGSDIPRDLLDRFLDPRGVTFHGAVTGGRLGSIETGVRFTPAAVPEPATLAAWGVVALGVLAIRRRRSAAVGTREG